MVTALTKKNPHLELVGEHWTLFLLWGLVLVALGLLAVSIATFTTLASVIFLGCVVLAGGIVLFVDAFHFWHVNWKYFFGHLIISLLYLAAGFWLLTQPVSAAVSLTLVLGVFYTVLGAFRLGTAFAAGDFLGWQLFNGVVALILGILILIHWPASSLFIIGLFVGIDLFISGFTYILLAFTARK